MKPYIEHVAHQRDFSWRLERYYCETSTFEWHYHLEYEIVILRNSQGQLFAGSHNNTYYHNTLALFGPRLPHTTYVEKLLPGHTTAETIVLWFSHSWITKVMESMSELQPLQRLLENTRHGLLFSEGLSEQVYAQLEGLTELSKMQQSWRIIEVLIVLAEAPQATKLNPVAIVEQLGDKKNQDRVAKAIHFISNNYQHSVSIDQLANHLHMSKSSVQRLFEKHFNESFSEHLKQYRIGKACEMLINTQLAVSLISERNGFGNLSNFNRQFRHCKSITPRQFRDQYRQRSESPQAHSL